MTAPSTRAPGEAPSAERGTRTGDPAGNISWIAIALLAALAALLAVAFVLWARYGTTVFFEIIAAGIAACF